MTNEFDYEDMTEEQIADFHLQEAIESAKLTLRMAETCFQKFGKQLLSDERKAIFQKIANGEFPNDEEMELMDNEAITYSMQAVRRARELSQQKAAQLGAAYEPELIFEDRTTGFKAN